MSYTQTPINGYKTENIELQYLSSLTINDCEMLIGKKIAKIYGREYSVVLVFTDNSELVIEGHTYGDSALQANYNEKIENK